MNIKTIEDLLIERRSLKTLASISPPKTQFKHVKAVIHKAILEFHLSIQGYLKSEDGFLIELEEKTDLIISHEDVRVHHEGKKYIVPDWGPNYEMSDVLVPILFRHWGDIPERFRKLVEDENRDLRKMMTQEES
jgi:hypothetical protein